MPHFVCPVCGENLSKGEKTYSCGKGHSFDIAKNGYVNLLMRSGGGHHGDDRLMVKARNDFLSKGYYDAFSNAVSDTVTKYAFDGVHIVDSGCGECKYTSDILNKLTDKGITPDISGIDISKDALHIGSRRDKRISLAVASVGSLPFEDNSTDIIVNLFAPFSDKEFSRILKPKGKVIRAYPLKNHLIELKSLIYDTPYENEESDMAEAGFEIIDTQQVKYTIGLEGENIMSLFKMTPYYYKTGAEDQKKAEKAEKLTVSLEFGITTYEKQ